MFNISKKNIIENIKKLTKEDIFNFASKYNIFLSNNELEFVYNFVKTNTSLLNNPKSFNLNLYKDKFTKNNFDKLTNLYNKYSNYLNLIELTD